jgi:CHAD domain-containing protein
MAGAETGCESRLSPPPGFRVPDLTGVAADLVVGERGRVELQTTYFDTADLRLARTGASLRFRTDDGWAVRLPDVDDPHLARTRHRFEGSPGSPPAAAVDLVRAWIRTAAVAPVTRLRTRRHEIALADLDGKPVAEIVDDEVAVVDGRRVSVRFRELKVVLAPRAPAELGNAIVARLREAGAGPLDGTPRVVRALGPLALGPLDVTPAVALHKRATMEDVVRATLAASVARLLALDAGVRLGDDPEFVHQARVAARRLRSDLRTFGSVLDPKWNAPLRAELGWIGTELGAVRDTEVLLDLLRAKAAPLGGRDGRAAAPILDRLVARWGNARIELLEAMRSPRYASLLDRLVDAVREPVLLPAALAPARGALPNLVAASWEQLRQAAEELTPHPADAELHAVRIRAKHCRYAAEAAAGVIGKPARSLARAVAALQDVLGAHQDAVVARSWLHEAAARSDGVEAFVAGELAGLVWMEERAAREVWPAAWTAASRKKLRSWL